MDSFELAAAILPPILAVPVWYQIVFRPRRYAREVLSKRVATLVPGDRIVVGGIVGEVVAIADATCDLEVRLAADLVATVGTSFVEAVLDAEVSASASRADVDGECPS